MRWLLIASILIVVVAVPPTLAQPSGVSIKGASAQGGLSLSPPEQTVQAETNFTLEVLADCGSNADGVGVVVTFDPVYLQVVAVAEDESKFPLVLRKRFDNSSGEVYYDAGAPLECHNERTCPAGVARLATLTFRAVTGTVPSTSVSISGEVVWAGETVFGGEGNGSIVTITSTARRIYLPLVVRGRAF